MRGGAKTSGSIRGSGVPPLRVITDRAPACASRTRSLRVQGMNGLAARSTTNHELSGFMKAQHPSQVVADSVIGVLKGDEAALGNVRALKSKGLITLVTE